VARSRTTIGLICLQTVKQRGSRLAVSDDNLGWREPVSTFTYLHTAVRTLLATTHNLRTRVDNATLALASLRSDDFPERIRNRATIVLCAREKVATNNGTDTRYHFERLTPRQRKSIADDIIALYEACIFDLGRMNRDEVYPEDRFPRTRHRSSKSRQSSRSTAKMAE
jgi:hypothetical protein